jgi:pyrophosphate--fructose-6-phosphate 1-phosphotransferase
MAGAAGRSPGFGNDPRRWDVHAVYVPELGFDIEAEAERLQGVMDELGCVNIFLSEGAGVETIVEEMIARGEEPQRDAFGHVKLDTINPGAWFAKQFAGLVGAEKTMVQKSGYFARSAAANADDLRLIKSCTDLAVEARCAARAASSGTTRSAAACCAPSSSRGSRAASRSTPSRRGSRPC